MFRRTLIATAVLFPLAVQAQEPPPAPAPAPEARKEIEVDPASKLHLFGLMQRMASSMAGERVVAVGWGDGRQNSAWDAEAFSRCRTTLERLQKVAEGFSPTDGHDLIPFKVGGSLVLAPETQEILNPDLARLDALSVSSRGTLLTGLLVGLSAKQLRQIGGPEGMPVALLTREQRAALKRALRPPLEVVQMKPWTGTNEDGISEYGWEVEEKGRIDEEIDWGQARVRANLRLFGAQVMGSEFPRSISASGWDGLVFAEDARRSAPWEDSGVALPVCVPAPNAFKPSDLDGRRFTQPLNLTGVWKVADVLSRLSASTGLKLKAHRMYAEVPVFIGSPAVTAGEVLDALRLSLTAAWRRLGDTYLLVWDRRGLGAIQQQIKEATSATSREAQDRRKEMETDPQWLQIAMTLPFDDDDPLALTPQQRKKVYAEPERDEPGSGLGISWEEMTPSQQEHLRSQAKLQNLQAPDAEGDKSPVRRPFTDEDLRRATLDGSCEAYVSVKLDSLGWVRTTNVWDTQKITPWQLQSMREKADPVKSREVAAQAVPEALLRLLEHPDPRPLPSSKTRAVMVPPMGVARLAGLAEEMKRHGFTTLLYPALFGGYATFQSRFFPLHPALHGADGLAAAQAAMKPAGIEVAAYLNTLTWQEEVANVHWLNKHKDWLDVDILGRPRLDWLRDNPGKAKTSEMIGIYRANTVCAAVPEVQARLTAFVREAAALPGIDKIAFSQWAVGPYEGQASTQTAVPALGYSLPDRLAAFRRTGEDPVDRVQDGQSYLPMHLLDDPGIESAPRVAEEEPDPDAALVSLLVRTAHEARKGMSVWVFDEEPWRSTGGLQGESPARNTALEKPDLRIASLFDSARPAGSDSRGVACVITKGDAFVSMMEMRQEPIGALPDAVRTAPSLAVYMAMGLEFLPASRIPAIVLDFRTAPEQITPSFAYVKAPEPAKSVGGGVAGPALQQGNGHAGGHGK